MGHCKRPRTSEFAPTNSGSKAKPEEREDYRKLVMREETGKEHLAQLSRTKDFDACMRRFASDAGDFETASRFAIVPAVLVADAPKH